MVKQKILVKGLAILTGALIFLVSTVSAEPPALVPKTGQTYSYATNDDGDYQAGVAWPEPRFTDNGDGTVADNMTGLMWTKNANLFGTKTWEDAITACEDFDPCLHGDWRLPNARELHSLVDLGNIIPALPSGHPFTNVQSDPYWSSTSYMDNLNFTWYVFMAHGFLDARHKTLYGYAWCVRGP